jgi:hypothetical protein
MAAPAAFSDLMEISSQVETAIVLDGDEIVASSISETTRAAEFAAAVRRLIDAAGKTRPGLKQLEVVLPEGHLFVVLESGRAIAAATAAGPPSGLVFYDLRACLSALAMDKTRSDAAE